MSEGRAKVDRIRMLAAEATARECRELGIVQFADGMETLAGGLVYDRHVERITKEHQQAKALYVAAGRPVPSWVLV